MLSSFNDSYYFNLFLFPGLISYSSSSSSSTWSSISSFFFFLAAPAFYFPLTVVGYFDCALVSFFFFDFEVFKLAFYFYSFELLR